LFALLLPSLITPAVPNAHLFTIVLDTEAANVLTHVHVTPPISELIVVATIALCLLHKNVVDEELVTVMEPVLAGMDSEDLPVIV